jgi:conjugal transfer ATP-binding protein TraC
MLISRKKRSRDLAEAIPIHTIENDKVVFKDGRVAVGYRISPGIMESWSAGEFEMFNESLRNQLGILPTHTVIQKTDFYFDQEYLPEAGGREYFETRLNRHFMYRLVLEHTGFLFLSFPETGQQARKRNPLSTLLNYSYENPFEHIEENLEIAETKAEEFISSLQGLGGIHFERLREAGLKELYSRYYTLNFQSAFEQGVYADISHSAAGLHIGEKSLWLVSMKGQGMHIYDAVRNQHGVTSAYTYMLANHLQVPHILTTTLWVDDTEKELRSLDREKRLNSNLEWMSTQDNEVKARLIDEFTDKVRSNSGRIVSMNVNVAIFDADYSLNKKYLESTLAAFRSMSGAECIVESWDTLPLYFANTPGNAANNYRWLRTSDEIGVKYFNFLSNYPSELKGDLLCDRFRNPLLVNFFNSELTNQNAVVVGPSGSGKSFTVGYFLVQRHERKARQIIIDVGGSYKNLLITLNGQKFEETYFEYDPAKPMAFNPFLVPFEEGRYLVSNERINFLMSLFFRIWRGDKTEEVEQVEKSILKELIRKYYGWLGKRREQRPCLNSFYAYCQEQAQRRPDEEDDFRYFDIRQFMTTLRPYHDGVYSAILNAEYETDISQHPLVCFDMNRIKRDSMLKPIITMLITQLALDQLEKYPEEEKYIYMDEAWSMLSGSFAEFIEEMYRTIRKSKGSMWVITQGVDEIVKSRIGNAILINAEIKVLLKHYDQKMISQVETHMGLTEQEMEKFISLRKESQFRELFVKMGDLSRVFALEPSEHHAIVLSSKPDERNHLVRLMKKYLKVSDAIEQYIESKRSA